MDEHLLQALQSVRTRAGGPGAARTIAVVGNWLIDAGLHPRQLPVAPLSAFLAQQVGFCEVVGADVIFRDGPPVEVDSSQAGFDPGEAGPKRRAIVAPELWRALVRDAPGEATFLDLDTLAILEVADRDPASAAPIQQTPERYLRVPTIPWAEQRAHALTVLPEGTELPESPRWLSAARAQLPEATFRELAAQRRAWILDRARAWLLEHGLREDRFIHSRPVAAAPAQGDDPLRAAVHRAVDQMTHAELAALLLPARLLIAR